MQTNNESIRLNVSKIVADYELTPSPLENEVEAMINAVSDGYPNGAVDMVEQVLTARYGAALMFRSDGAVGAFCARHKGEIDALQGLFPHEDIPVSDVARGLRAFMCTAYRLAWESFDHECDDGAWEPLISAL